MVVTHSARGRCTTGSQLARFAAGTVVLLAGVAAAVVGAFVVQFMIVWAVAFSAYDVVALLGFRAAPNRLAPKQPRLDG